MEPQKKYIRRGTPDCPLSISLHTKKPASLNTPHYHADIEMIYAQQGDVLYCVDGKDASLSSGEILLISPGQIHRFISCSEDARIWFFCFPPELLTTQDGYVMQEEFVKPMQAGLLRLPPLIRPGHPAYEQVILALSWLEYCSNMVKPNYKALRYAMAVSICAALLPWCTPPEVEHSPVDSDNTIVQQVMSYILRNYRKQLTLQDIADNVHLHPNYLCALFKKHTGHTVMYHLDKTRVDTASFLLEKTQLSMSQISERSGYRNESVFYYKFKKLTDMTPTQYRTKHSMR